MWHVQTSLRTFMRAICKIVCICAQCSSLYEFCTPLADLFVFVGLVRGSISKYVTNGNKTTVMDLIGFLCATLGRSTVKLQGRRACSCSEASFSNQNGDRA
jgi:hypothetical protein